MKKREVIGKYVDVVAAQTMGWEYTESEFIYEDDCEALESPLLSTEQPTLFYSVVLKLKSGRIIDLVRVEHCHLCGGQGSDSEVSRLPSCIEEELRDEIVGFICTRQ